MFYMYFLANEKKTENDNDDDVSDSISAHSTNNRKNKMAGALQK